MGQLFEHTPIKNMELRNRFVRSATWEGLAGNDGSATPRLVETLVQLARGGLGLIISSHAYVSREGQAGRWQLGVYSDELMPGLIRMVRAVHEVGGKIALQLAHAGYYANFRLSGLEPVAPSTVETDSGPVGREMTEEDRQAVIHAFSQAAVRARKAGFDAVQIHGAHGYLITQFLSPFFNKRKDAYGGAIENRVRFPLEIVKGVRKAVGLDYPVIIKLNCEDFLPRGFTVDEMLHVARKFEEAGIDAIEMSGGTFLSGNKSPSRPGKLDPGELEAYYEDAAKRYKKKVTAPLMLVGGIRTFEAAERLVAEGTTDYIALCRPLIREPDLINRWQSGDRRPALCISDNGCFKPGFAGKGVHCVVAAREAKRND